MNGNKKISVIIPIYNAERYLKQTLDSIRSQTHANLEIVCVLDCPTDGSTVIAEQAANEDERIKIIRNPKNMGLPVTRNLGVENATGEYMHFMDADDLINPCFYEVLINAASEADADVAACSVIYEQKPWRGVRFEKNEAVTSNYDKITKTEVTLIGWAWRYLIRRDFWNRNNISFPDLMPMEDTPAMITTIYYANKVALCTDAVYFYKNREDSILNTELKKRDNTELVKLYKENRTKSYNMFKSFMLANGIKRPPKFIRQRERARHVFTRANYPVKYGMTDKKVSVIIPIYNVQKYLKEALDCIRFQTYKNLEIVCVSDCLNNGSTAIAKEAAKADDRVKIISHAQDTGLGAALNAGVRSATGEYIHFMDANDVINPDFYDIMAGAAEKYEADVAACSVFCEKKTWRSIWYKKSEAVSGTAKIDMTEAASTGWIWRYLIKKTFWENNGFQFHDLVTEDRRVMLQMIFEANKVALCPYATYIYKNRQKSLSDCDRDPERRKRHSAIRKKTHKMFREFIREKRIKHPNKLQYYIKKRFPREYVLVYCKI